MTKLRLQSRSSFWRFLRASPRLLVTLLLVLGLIGALGVVQMSQVLFTKAVYQPANIVVNAANILGPLPRPWANLAQGGEEPNWRLQPLLSQLETIRPEYIRIDHLFDQYVTVSGSPDNLQLDFTALDRLLADVRQLGARPYLALSYMPPSLSVDGQVTGAPVQYAVWQELVRQLVQHVSGTLGFDKVYYEVWNEPDLYGKWRYGGQKNYLELYGAAARGAAAARVPTTYKIGGPATTALYKNWIQALAQYAQKNNLRLDFLTWHRYTTDLDQYRKDAFNVRQWLSDTPTYQQNAEFHISEWGHNSELDLGYDNDAGAAHTAAAAISMVGVIERAFVFEIQDGKDPQGKAYWGRWGLFTHQSAGAQPKPRFRALQLLNRLGPQRLELLGNGTYVKAVATTSDDHVLRIALANYDPAGQNVETVPVLINSMPPGPYKIVTNYLNRQPSTTDILLTDVKLALQVPLRANDVALVEISLQ